MAITLGNPMDSKGNPSIRSSRLYFIPARSKPSSDSPSNKQPGTVGDHADHGNILDIYISICVLFSNKFLKLYITNISYLHIFVCYLYVIYITGILTNQFSAVSCRVSSCKLTYRCGTTSIYR